MMYGRDPEYVLHESVDPELNQQDREINWYWKVKQTRKIVAQYIQDAYLSNKEKYDRVVRPQEFKEGDAVLLYRERPRNTRGPRKLLPRYVGPYRVEEVVGKTCKIRPIYAPQLPVVRYTTAIFDHLRHCDEDRMVTIPREITQDPAEIDGNLEEELPE